MRGERARSGARLELDSGLSPHARGTLVFIAWRRRSTRIIPACAGNAILLAKSPNSKSDYPRMRGERSVKSFVLKRFDGLSPHARGTR